MSKILPIITMGHPTLETRAQEVLNIQKSSVQKLIDAMIETMYVKDGIGLAAPQVNQSYRIAVLCPELEKFEQYRKKEKKNALVIINPVIEKHSLFKTNSEEGCLSVPDIFGIVKRFASVSVSYFDRDGAPQQINAKGLLAHCLQHEIDHLDGILFIKKAHKLYRLVKNM